MSKWFPFLLFWVAILIAGNAAYFSVKGIGLLFAGSFMSVIIMASSLEIGKLFAVSFLYRKWHELRWLMKSYLTTATLLLMIITSVGIFGFLSDAYQDTKTKVDLYEGKIVSIQKENDNYNDQIQSITQARTSVDGKTSSTVNTYSQIYQDLEARIKSRVDMMNDRLKVMDAELLSLQSSAGGLFSSKKSKIEALKSEQSAERQSIRDETTLLNDQLADEYKSYMSKIDDLSKDTRSNIDTQQQVEPIYQQVRDNEQLISEYNGLIGDTDIGSFKFIAKSLDVETDTAVKWFILMIVVVFDPLAVCLIVGYNMYAMRTPYDGYVSSTPAPTPAPSKIKNIMKKLVPGREPRLGQEGR